MEKNRGERLSQRSQKQRQEEIWRDGQEDRKGGGKEKKSVG
jgi:hypothetical protein